MEIITINENNLTSNDINETRTKVRAILIDDDKILTSNYGGVILLPGGSIDVGETKIESLIRELKEETGILYSSNDLQKLFILNHYQANYKTRDNNLINRLVTTEFYIGKFKGIDELNVKKTEKEKKDNLYLELLTLKEILQKLENNNNQNPRKYFFDREMQEAIKVYKKTLTK